MSLSNFPFSAFILFVVIALFTPVSLALLRRERHRNPDILAQTTLVTVFLIEVLLWVVIVLVAGFALLVMLGMFVMVNAHVRANSNTSAPLSAMLMIFGVEGMRLVVGFLLHTRASDKLWSLARCNRTIACCGLG